jgi:hypothetical protein
MLGVAQETGGSSNTYTRDPNGVPVEEQTGGFTLYPVWDANGSMIGLVSSQDGNMIQTANYDPFGAITSQSGPLTQPCQYECASGARTDPQTDLVMGTGAGGMGGLYDPDTATMTQSDDGGLAAGASSPQDLWGRDLFGARMRTAALFFGSGADLREATAHVCEFGASKLTCRFMKRCFQDPIGCRQRINGPLLHVLNMLYHRTLSSPGRFTWSGIASGLCALADFPGRSFRYNFLSWVFSSLVCPADAN